MKILIENQQDQISLNTRWYQRQIKKILAHLELKDAELSVLFVESGRIQELNKAYRKIDQPTDVLSFPMQEGMGKGVAPFLLGDVVICPSIVAASEYPSIHPFGTELPPKILFILIHGILHLLGFSHESSSGEQAMVLKKLEIFKAVVDT